MWFLLGIVVLVGAGLGVGWYRWQVDWKGQPFGTVRFKVNSHKGKIQLLRVGLDTQSALDFELKPERWYDRTAKAIGVSSEPQVGRNAFDQLVYLIADDERLPRALRADSALLQQFEQVCRAPLPDFGFHRLVCRRGQLWLDLKPKGSPSSHEAALHWAAEALPPLTAALPTRRPGQGYGIEPLLLKSIVLLSISSALAITGGAEMLRLAFGTTPFTVDLGQLWIYAALAAVVAVFALALATLFLLGNSSRAHLVLFEVVLVGGFGALTTGFAELRDLNMEADTRPAVTLDTQVLDKHISRGRRSTTYHVKLADWNGGGGTHDLHVTSSQYDRFTPGLQVQLRQRPGLLGVRWVEQIVVYGVPL